MGVSNPKNFLFLNQNICCGYSKEPSQRDGSFEQPKLMFKLKNKKIIAILRIKVVFIYIPMKAYTFSGHIFCTVFLLIIYYIMHTVVIDQWASRSNCSYRTFFKQSV